MSNGEDLLELTRQALREGYRDDVRQLFRNYIGEVVKATGNPRKLERAAQRFEEGLRLSKEALTTLGEIVREQG